MFKLTGLHITIGQRLLFKQNVDIALVNGLYGLIGRNGSGKSTLFNTIIGQHKSYEGSILVNDVELDSLGNDFSREIAIVKTHPDVYGDLTVEDVLWLGRTPYQNLLGIRKKEDQVIIDKALNDLGLSTFKETQYSNLSDGEKQLVMIGRAIVQDTPILLLDEPLAFLDLVNQKEVLSILKSISENKVVVFSTHHIHLLNDVCDDVLMIHDNELNTIGKSNDYTKEITSIFGLN